MQQDIEKVRQILLDPQHPIFVLENPLLDLYERSTAKGAALDYFNGMKTFFEKVFEDLPRADHAGHLLVKQLLALSIYNAGHKVIFDIFTRHFGTDAGRIALGYLLRYQPFITRYYSKERALKIITSTDLFYVIMDTMPKSIQAVEDKTLFLSGQSLSWASYVMHALIDEMRSEANPYTDKLSNAWAWKIYTWLKKEALRQGTPMYLKIGDLSCRLFRASLSSGVLFPYEKDVAESIKKALSHSTSHPLVDIFDLLCYWLCLEGDGPLGIYESFDIAAKIDQESFMHLFTTKGTALHLAMMYPDIESRIINLLSISSPGHPLYSAFSHFCFSLMPAPL